MGPCEWHNMESVVHTHCVAILVRRATLVLGILVRQLPVSKAADGLPLIVGVSTGVVWCGVVWCGVVWCGVVWCGVVWCGVVWCGVVWCGVVWCGVVWFLHLLPR